MASWLRQPLPWILLLAFAVRLIGLTYHSLWFDEIVSAVWAAKPAGEIWRQGLSFVQDKHPPLYYIMLHAWTRVLGDGDVPVRLLGVVLGGLAVLPAYGIGQRLGGRRAAGLGAFLLALNPFLIWYSQEARMFMPATTFLLAGLYGILLLAEPAPVDERSGVGRKVWRSAIGPAILTVLGLAAALYTYLFSALVLPVAGLWLVLLAFQGRGLPGHARRIGMGFGSLVVVALLFLPLARNAWMVSGAESVPGRPFEGAAQALGALLAIYALGWPRWAGNLSGIIAAAALLVALFGVAVPDRWLASSSPAGPQGGDSAARVSRGEPVVRRGGWFLAIGLAVPVALGGLLLARDRTVFAESRYLIFLVPVLCLAWGRGLAAVWTWRRGAGWVALGLVVAFTLAALPANWSSERRREAWRETAALVAAQASPNDALLVYPDYLRAALERYFNRPQPLFTPFTDAIDDPAAIERPLQGLMAFDVTWLVESHHEPLDPGNLLPGWFAARFPLVTEQFPAGVAVRGFATQYRRPELPAYVPPLNQPAAVGPVQLLACVHDPGPIAAKDDLYHPPSGWVHVTTYWTASEQPATDVAPQVRLVDQAGQVWGDQLARANDAFRLWPTSRWIPGEVVRLDSDVNLNPITPPGRYRVIVGVPDGGDPVICGEIDVR
jgi:hypothetical protein